MHGDELDVVVAGGGIVGLAIARELSRRGREVHLLEAEPRLGTQTSSRNSEVIHAGLYYPPGSLKARLCVRGNALLYRYCEEAGVPHRRLGKLLVASDAGELDTLERYARRAHENGVRDLVRLSAREAQRLEPAVVCQAALLSPSSGIVDAHALLAALKRDAEDAGASVVTRSPILGGRCLRSGFELAVGGAEPMQTTARTFVNTAGLFAQELARRLEGLDPATIPPCHYAKGHYFTLRGASPFARLVYPLPSADGLGVHVTLDLSGRARFGPDVAWVERVDYGFEESRQTAFEEAIRRYYPALRAGDLMPGYTGIRPKLGPHGSAPSDFVIQSARTHGVPGLLNLYGIESPGLTSALALAEEVASVLERDV